MPANKQRKTKVFIDAFSLVPTNGSGVSHVTAETIRAVANSAEFMNKYQLYVVLPVHDREALKRYHLEGIKAKRLWLPGRIANWLLKYNLMPPLDLFFGKGIYIFPNYRNWPLLSSK